MVKFLKAATVLGAAGFVAWKFLRDSAPGIPETLKPSSQDASGGSSSASKPGASSASKSGGASPSKPAASSGGANGSGATKAELYERAKALGIEGRSKMSKQDLERAIREAG